MAPQFSVFIRTVKLKIVLIMGIYILFLMLMHKITTFSILGFGHLMYVCILGVSATNKHKTNHHIQKRNISIRMEEDEAKVEVALVEHKGSS